MRLPWIRDRRPNPWHDLGLVFLAVALLAVIWLVAGCGERAAAAVVHGATGAAGAALPRPPAPTSTGAADEQLKALRKDRDELARQVELKDSAIDRVEKERDELAKQDLRRRLAWLGGLVLVGALASVGLWFVLPTGFKAWAVYGGLGCLGVAGAAFALRAVVPYLELIGWVLVGAGVVFGLWKLRRLRTTAEEFAAHGDRLETAMRNWFPGDVVEGALAAVKRESRSQQAAKGVARLGAAIRGKPLLPVPGPA